jgi:hypothetical protein
MKVFGFNIDPTPGFNLSHDGLQPYIAATGTKNVIGLGGDPTKMVADAVDVNKQVAADKYYAANGNFSSPQTGANGTQPKSPSTTVPNGKVLGASTGPSAQDLAAYGIYRNEATKDLGKLLGSYNATKQSLNSNYDIKGNQLDSAKAHAQDNYNDSVTQTNQDLLRQQNQVNQGTYNAYHNLMNLLGAYGGGGTSVAQNWAPTAAQHFQNAQLGDANQTAASNLHSLNTNWGNYMNDYDQQKKQLVDSRGQDLANADSQYNSTRDQLNAILDRISSQAVAPGDIGGALGGINVPNVNFVKPTYTGETPVYNAPNLSTFEAAPIAANFATPAQSSNSAAAPALAFLLSQQKRQQQPAVA